MNDTNEKDEEKTGCPEEEEEEEEEAAAVDDLRNGNNVVVAGGGRGGNDDNDDEGSSHGSVSSRTSAISASLLDEIRELRLEELQAEWLDAARYDDLTILRAIHRHVTSTEEAQKKATTDGSSSSSNDPGGWMGVSVRDGSGNTALHMSAANGHASVVKWLLRTHDKECRRPKQQSAMSTSEFVMLPNEAGNTALHWAAANGRADVVQVLLRCEKSTTAKEKHQREDPNDERNDDNNDGPIVGGAAFDGIIDVLQKNNFGRSVLTEAFQGDNQDVIQLVLEHPSASEERLLTVSPAAVESRGSNNNSKGSTDTLTANIDETALNGTNVGEQVNDADEGATSSIIQELVFGGKSDDDPTSDVGNDDDDRDNIGAEIHVRVREVAMATHSDQIVADQDDPEHDRTGLSVWSSSVVAAHWMSHIDLRPHLLDGSDSSLSGVVALELGAGCAVPSLVLAKRLARLLRPSSQSPQAQQQIHHVYASDWNDEVLDNIRHNLQLNELALKGEEVPTLPSTSKDSCECRAIRMDWNDPSSWEPWRSSTPPTVQSAKDHQRNPRKPTIIVGADLIYQPSMVEAFVQVVLQLLDRASKHARFYYVAPLKPRSGGPELIRRLLEEFRLVASTVAPPGMKRNPLQSQDDDLCFLHFQDLLTSDFRLYEFAWRQL